jgi:hypothetical protein
LSIDSENTFPFQGHIIYGSTLEAIIKEARRIEENALYTSKAHFVCAQGCENLNLWIGIPTVILAAIAGALAFTNFLTVIAGVLSIIIAILTGIATFLNLKDKSRDHQNAGNKYDSLLTRVRIFRAIDCRQNQSEEVSTEKLKDLSRERDRLNADCPQPSKKCYKRAKEGIEAGEAEYKVDKDESDKPSDMPLAK